MFFLLFCLLFSFEKSKQKSLIFVSIGSTQIGEQKAPQVQFNLFDLVLLAKQLFSKPKMVVTPTFGQGWLFLNPLIFSIFSIFVFSYVIYLFYDLLFWQLF